MYKNSRNKNCGSLESGFSMLELMIVLFMNSIILATVATNFRTLERPLTSAGELTIGYFRLARASSISRTVSYVIYPSSSNKLSAKSGKNCEIARANSITEEKLSLELPRGVLLQSTSWDVCITPRGFMDDSIVFDLFDEDGKRLKINTFLGGTAKVL